MLQQLRVASKSWVASVVIGVLVLAFALWGVADIFHASTDTTVATVGQQTISVDDFQTELKNQLKTISAQSQTEVTMEQAHAFGLDRQVLDEAINRAALDEHARKLGLIASQAAVAATIRNNNTFFGAGGAFDQNVFQSALQNSGLSEQGYITATAQDTVRGQLISAVSDGIVAPDGLTRLLFDFVNEQRVADYIVLTPDDAGQVPEPTEAAMTAYHKAHAEEFSSPEYRSLDYVQIGPEQTADGIQISDADIKAQYDAHKADYDKPEQRDIEQISFPDQASAEAAATRLKAGADFTAIAHERGLKDADVKLGTFAPSGLAPELSKAAFAVPEGGTTAPVKGPFNWVILRTTHITPGVTKSLDEVKDQIKADLLKSRAAGKVADFANAFEDARGGGATLQQAAQKQKLTVHHVAAVDAKGMTPEGTKADVPAAPQFLQAAFATESGEESELFQTQDGENYAVRVDSVTPPAVKPLDAVRAQVREGVLAEAREQQLQLRAQTLADQARKEGSLDGIAKSLGRMPTASMPLRRNQPDDVFSAALSNQVFLAPQGSVVAGPAAKGGGYVIARVASITHPQPDIHAPDYANFQKNMAEQLSGEVVESMAAAARKDAGVNIHEATLQQTVSPAQQ